MLYAIQVKFHAHGSLFISAKTHTLWQTDNSYLIMHFYLPMCMVLAILWKLHMILFSLLKEHPWFSYFQVFLEFHEQHKLRSHKQISTKIFIMLSTIKCLILLKFIKMCHVIFVTIPCEIIHIDQSVRNILFDNTLLFCAFGSNVVSSI